MTANILTSNLLDRVQSCVREWRLEVEDIFETETSAIAFVSRGGQALVLKVGRQPGDEWHSGEILAAFGGRGVVRVYEHTPGAMLIERLRPGNSLVPLTVNGKDEEATHILAEVIQKMSSHKTPNGCPSIQDWAKGFERYIASDDTQIPRPLVESAQRVYTDLSTSQRRTRLLHGDLHHYNVLFDSDRGWLAIDPKGVIGELEFEVGAVLRNPVERSDLFLSRSTIEGRLNQFTSMLGLDYHRALAWGFAQDVLSAIWEVEDGYHPDSSNSRLQLAAIIQPLLKG